MDGWSIRRRVAVVALAVCVATGLGAVWPTVGSYARAAAILNEGVLGVPVRPLSWVAPAPLRSELRWPGGGEGVLTAPGGGGAHPAFVLMLGAEPAPPSDPRVRRLTGALARTGFATLLVRSTPLTDGVVTPDEVPLLVGAFEALRADPRARPDRIGFIGLSAGASLEIIAASDAAIAGDVWCIFALGPYGDAATYLAEVFSGEYREPDGQAVAWKPDAQARSIASATLIAALSPADRAAIALGQPPATHDGTVARQLLSGSSLQAAQQLVATLGPAARSTLTALSPVAHLSGLRAPLYLVHDRHDPYIPWTQSAAIAALHHAARWDRVDLFRHVEAHPRNVGVLLRDGWRLIDLFASIVESAR